MTAELRDMYDVAVVGAGPAGLAAASLCARAGLATAIFDEQGTPGGQIYRGITTTPLKERAILGEDYWAGEPLAKEMLASGAHYVPRATVESLTPELEIGISIDGGSRLVRAKRVILATGALERPFPIPGGTLPGVMGAGAAQAMLKSSGIVPAGRTVIAGSGPLLWLLASQLLKAGATIDAILDTTPVGNRAAALPHVFGFLFSPYFRKGLRLLMSVRGKVKVEKGVTALEADGDRKLASVTYRTISGKSRALPADNLLLHRGVVPNVNLAMSAGVEHCWDKVQLCWTPRVRGGGRTSVGGVYVTGDAAGIAGAQAAAWRGVLTGSEVIAAVRPEIARASERYARTALKQFGRGRRFLDLRYRPAE